MKKSRFLRLLIYIIAPASLLIFFQNCGYGGFRAAGFADLASLDEAASGTFNNSGKALYSAKCSACHGEISSSTKADATVARIQTALNTVPQMAPLKSGLSMQDLISLEAALSTTVTPGQCDVTVAGNVPAHRLSNHEYNNVIRDLTGLDTKPASKFPNDPYTVFFTNIAATLGVDMSLAKIYMDSAMDVLDNAFSKNRGFIVTCNPSTLGERQCAEKVVKEFGQKAFRRPLTTAEVSQFVTLYDDVRKVFPAGVTASAFDESLKGALQAIMISPNFLYRIIEMPTTDPNYVKPLTAYEVASRLSFMIWGSLPDSTLLNLAANGTLLDKAVLDAQVDRMLKDSKSSHMVDVFAFQWLKIDKLGQAHPASTTYPEFNDTIRQAMLTESRMLLSDMIQKDGSPYLVINADYTYLNTTLANHYGLPDPANANFTRVSLANSARAGILTHGSVLTTNARPNESSIVQRGLWTLDRILCTPVGGAPPGAASMLPPDTASSNPRKSIEMHASNPNCAACHDQIDPAGFGLENFDGVGKFRTNYRNGDVVDASGKFPDGLEFTSAKELSQVLTKNVKYRYCAARNLMIYGLGRILTPSDKCAADSIGYYTVTPSGKFSDLVKSLVTSEQFLKQRGGI